MLELLTLLGILALAGLAYLVVSFIQAKRRHASYAAITDFMTHYVAYDFDAFIFYESTRGPFDGSLAWIVSIHEPQII